MICRPDSPLASDHHTRGSRLASLHQLDEYRTLISYATLKGCEYVEHAAPEFIEIIPGRPFALNKIEPDDFALHLSSLRRRETVVVTV